MNPRLVSIEEVLMLNLLLSVGFIDYAAVELLEEESYILLDALDRTHPEVVAAAREQARAGLVHVQAALRATTWPDVEELDIND